MAKEKITIFKREILIFFIYLLYNLKLNSKYLVYFLLWSQLIFTVIFFGIYNFLGIAWHILVLTLFASSLIYLLIKLKVEFKYKRKKHILFLIERNNFKSINPLNVLKDYPEKGSFNKNIWVLHKLNSKKHLELIKFYMPKINLSKNDPLKVRYLLFLFLFLSMFWSYKNDQLYQNFYNTISFNKYLKKEDFFVIKAWTKPPKYTNLVQRLIEIPEANNDITIVESLPINSEFKIMFNSSKKKYLIKEDKNLLETKTINKNNHELNLSVIKNRNIIITKKNKDEINFKLEIIKDKAPKIDIISKPSIVNNVSLSLTFKTMDDYGVKDIFLSIKRPLEYNHFNEKFIKYKLFTSKNFEQDSKLIESYFYQNLSEIVWAGSNTFLELIAGDFAGQKSVIKNAIKIPAKKFNAKLAIKILNLREKLAKKEITVEELQTEIIKLFKNNDDLLNYDRVKLNYEEIIEITSKKSVFQYSLSNPLFKKLYDTAEIIEDGSFYISKKKLEQIEQNLFDSIKQKESDKVSKNADKLKETIESLLDLKNETNKDNSFNNIKNKNIKSQIEQLTQQIEDLLKTGSQDGVDEKMQKLQQLSESIKNPKNNKEVEERFQQKQDFINKLSELLNEQEKVMEETFNRAAEREKI